MRTHACKFSERYREETITVLQVLLTYITVIVLSLSLCSLSGVLRPVNQCGYIRANNAHASVANIEGLLLIALITVSG